jgi:hypothetical protein
MKKNSNDEYINVIPIYEQIILGFCPKCFHGKLMRDIANAVAIPIVVNSVICLSFMFILNLSV